MISLSDTKQNLLSLRRCAAVLLAYAVKELFPGVQLVEGDTTDYGFYYDFIFEQRLPDQAFPLIEVKIKALIKEGLEIRSLSIMRENAGALLLHTEQPFLAERAIQEELNIISLLQIGEVYDICPPLPFKTTAELGCIKLLEVTQELSDSLEEQDVIEVIRIQGTAFTDPSDLKKMVKAFNQLKKRDHRYLGPQLGLFAFLEETGSVNCFWYPKGEVIKRVLKELWEGECQRQHASFVSTPLVVKSSFLKTPHLFPPFSIKEEEYVLSQSRLSHHLLLFNQLSKQHEPPIRFAEVTCEYREWKKTQLWGLFRSNSWTSDTLSVFCKQEGILKEIISSLHFFLKIVKIFNFEGQWYLVASKQKGSYKKREERAIQWFAEALQQCELPYLIEETQDPKGWQDPCLEMRFTDCLGREWRGPHLEIPVHSLVHLSPFQGKEGSQAPVILIKSLFDSWDRFIALLIEQCEGIFPLWLAPEQIRVLAIGEQNLAYASHVFKECEEQGFRVQLDSRSEKLGIKIHEAEREKIPYLIIVGEKERNKQLVTIRSSQQREGEQTISLNEFLKNVQQRFVLPN